MTASWARSSSTPWWLISLTLAIVFGILSPRLMDLGSVYWSLLVAVATLPLLTVIVAQSPRAAIFLFFLSQPLEGFELATPFGTLSLGIALLALIFLFWGRDIGSVLSRPSVARWFIFVLVYVAIHFLQLVDNPLNAVLRSLVTIASYASFWVLGAWIGYRKFFKQAAFASVIAVLTMGILGLGVALGLLPATARVGVVRTLLGFESPFPRTYGTDLPFDATAFLVALAIPALTVPLFSPGFLLRKKLGSLVLLVVIVGFFFLTFQSRNLIVQALAGIGVVLFLRSGLWGKGAILAAGGYVGFKWVWPSIYADSSVSVSSDLRVYAMELALDIMRNSSDWMFGGISQTRIFDLYADRYPLVLAAGLRQGHQAIHNLVLNEFVNAGLIAGLLLCTIFAVSAYFLIYLHRKKVDYVHGYYSDYLITAFCLAVIVVLIEPVSSNAVGLWALLGMIVGYRAVVQSESTDATAVRTQDA